MLKTDFRNLEIVRSLNQNYYWRPRQQNGQQTHDLGLDQDPCLSCDASCSGCFNRVKKGDT